MTLPHIFINTSYAPAQTSDRKTGLREAGTGNREAALGVEDRAGECVRGGGSRIAEIYTCEYNSHGRLTAFEVSLVGFFQATIFF